MKTVKIGEAQSAPEHVSEQDPADLDAVPQPVQEEDGDEAVFPEASLEPLRGLLFVGFLEDEVEYAGHSFHIRTLTEGEILRVGQLAKPYSGTMVELESRKMLTVAACCDRVDGAPVSESYKEGYDQIYERSREVRKWYPATIRAVYEAYVDLESAAVAASDALGK